jgi:hypothetical protein
MQKYTPTFPQEIPKFKNIKWVTFQGKFFKLDIDQPLDWLGRISVSKLNNNAEGILIDPLFVHPASPEQADSCENSLCAI